MTRTQEEKKRGKLMELLKELSTSQERLDSKEKLNDYFKRLENIYCYDSESHFRHYYSDVFSILVTIDSLDNEYNLDILAQNMNTIRSEYNSRESNVGENTVDISKEIKKLYDHINLEIARINYIKKTDNDTKSQFQLINSSIRSVEEQGNNLSEKLEKQANKFSEEIKDNQTNMQKDYITILGIFTSIVLAFTGGMFFSSSVLENIDKVSIYRLTYVVLLLFGVIFNIMWLLIDYLKYINSKSHGRIWLLVLVNIAIGVAIFVVFHFYKCGFVNS